MKVKVGSLIGFILAIVVTTGCGNTQTGLSVIPKPRSVQEVTSLAAYQKPSNPLPSEEVHQLKRVTLASVGDIMVHRPQLIKAFDGESFDFSPSFQYIKTYIQGYDYAIANLETTMAGRLGQRQIRTEKFYAGYSGYPVFNAPDILAENLKEAGFDMLLTANNHTLDSKVEGLERTIDVIAALDLDHTGTFKTLADNEKDCIIEVDGITFGILDYTYAMNGFTLSKEEDFKIHHLNNYDGAYIDAMYQRVEAMSQLDVDFVVVAIHYGIEYVSFPDQRIQKPLVDGLFDHGADIILGGHPHVLQPFEVREVLRNDGEVEVGVVIYSLGNFISSQRHIYTNKDTDYGMIFEIGIEQLDKQKPRITTVGYMPTYVLWTTEDPIVVPLLEIPATLEVTGQDQARIEHGRSEVVERVNSYYKGNLVFEGPKIVANLKEMSRN